MCVTIFLLVFYKFEASDCDLVGGDWILPKSREHPLLKMPTENSMRHCYPRNQLSSAKSRCGRTQTTTTARSSLLQGSKSQAKSLAFSPFFFGLRGPVKFAWEWTRRRDTLSKLSCNALATIACVVLVVNAFLVDRSPCGKPFTMK